MCEQAFLCVVVYVCVGGSVCEQCYPIRVTAGNNEEVSGLIE